VFPRKFTSGRKERVNYDLFAANGTTIPTYGWLSLNLNLGLRRDFTWLFVVADIQTPVIGVKLLSHFGLIVDCRDNRLLDGVTSLSTPAQAANLLMLSALKPSVAALRSTASSTNFQTSLAPRELSARFGTTPSTTLRRYQGLPPLSDHVAWHQTALPSPR
jgi:hypothetical protein